jgi:phosphatidylglycerol---prolipoprotein diacylglyceryl transferase
MLTFTPIPMIGWGGVGVSTHGLVIAIGFVVALLLARRNARKRGINVDIVDNAALVAVVAGLIGARAVYVAVFGRDMQLMEMLKMWHGGLSSHGGYVFGIIGGLLYVRFKKINVFKFADAVIPYLLIGWAIGRVGCFLNWDSFGIVDYLPWSVVVNGEPHIPTQLYESLGFLLGFWLLLSKNLREIVAERGSGSLAAVALFVFAFVRYAIDFLRADVGSYILFSRIVTIAVMAGAVVFYLLPASQKKFS